LVAAFFYNYNEKHHCPTQCRHAGHMHTSHRVPAGPAAHCTASAVRAVRPHGCWPMHACSLTTRVDFGAAPARVAPDPASCPSTGPLPPPSSRPQNRRACIVGGHHQRAVQRDRQAAHGGADLGHELAAARVGGQVPHADVAVLVACARRRWAGLSLPAPARAARQRPPGARGRAATENACSFIIGQPRSQRRAPACPRSLPAPSAPAGTQTAVPAGPRAPEISSPWLGCSATVLTAARDWYSRWQPGARRSQMRTVPSSEPEYIHLLSFWKPTCAPAGRRPVTPRP